MLKRVVGRGLRMMEVVGNCVEDLLLLLVRLHVNDSHCYANNNTRRTSP